MNISNNDQISKSHKKHRRHHKKDRKHHHKSHRSKSDRSKDSSKSSKSLKNRNDTLYPKNDTDINLSSFTRYYEENTDIEAVIPSKSVNKYVYEDSLINDFDINIRKSLKKVALLTQELEYEKVYIIFK